MSPRLRVLPIVAAAGLLACLGLAGCGGDAAAPSDVAFTERRPFAPRTYVAQRTSAAPTIDGNLTDDAWTRAAWTAPFVNSDGRDRPAPPFRTRAKMTWDDRFLYLAALDADELSLPDGGFAPTLAATQTLYEITAPATDSTVAHIRQNGRVWTTEN